MATPPGYMYACLADAVSESGSPRSVYSQDTTLSRRGLLTRADRRARELAAAGVARSDVVALAMGNVAEFLVLLLAVSKLGAVAMPVDPTSGDKLLLDATARLPVRAVVRRPRGLEATALDYPEGYTVRSRRRLTSSLLTLDALDPPPGLVELPAGAELILEVRGIGGAVRDVVRTSAHLEALSLAAASVLGLDAGMRLMCAQPFTVPRFFDVAVLGWLGSRAQLIMAEGPTLSGLLPMARGTEQLFVIDSLRQFIELARVLKSTNQILPLTAVLPQATVPLPSAKGLKQVFEATPRQLLLLEEGGVLASRTMERSSHFVPAHGVELEPGAAMQCGGSEVLVRTAQASPSIPGVPEGEPGSLADDTGFIHTGYAGRFSKQRGLIEIVGRDDGLVNLEGRRACLDSIEDVMLEHRRLTWARAILEHAEDGDPEIHLEYRATGETDVDDIEEHAVGHLPPFMVPRAFIRVGGDT